MMGNWRVVIVRDAQALAANARMRSVLEALLSRKLPGLALVLSAQMDSDAAIWKQVERKAKSITFKALPEGELPDWLTLHAEVQGITLEPAAARALAAAAGPTLGRLTQELEKLGQWVGDRKRINTSDVRALVGHIPNETRWEWIDMVGEARFRDARKALPPLLESESGVGLLIGLGTHLLRLALLLSDEQQLVNLLPFHQARWLPGRLKSQARNWSVPRLEAALGDVTRADRLLKSASLDDRQVMEELLLRMQCRHAAAA
jgi:DNA polymerase III delta subunit